MEPQVTICCNKKERKNCICLGIVIFFISVLLALNIGLIIGAALFTVFLGNLAVIIATAVILLILLIIAIILKICCERKRY